MSHTPVAKPAEPVKPPMAQEAECHDFSDPYCRNFNRPGIGDRKMVRCCVACGRAQNADNIGGRCVPVTGWRDCFEANINTDALTNVLHDPAIPERLTRAQLASDYYDDCLEEAGR